LVWFPIEVPGPSGFAVVWLERGASVDDLESGMPATVL